MSMWGRLTEALQARNDSSVFDPGEDRTDASRVQAIKNGLKVQRSPRQTFWDDFLQVTGDANSLADLLGVDASRVRTWGPMVRKYLKVVQDEVQPPKKRQNMIHTGDQPAPQPGPERPNPFMAG